MTSLVHRFFAAARPGARTIINATRRTPAFSLMSASPVREGRYTGVTALGLPVTGGEPIMCIVPYKRPVPQLVYLIILLPSYPSRRDIHTRE